VELGEELESAAKREVKEETGFDVHLIKKLTVLENPFPGTKETHVYLGEIIGGKQQFSTAEILDLRWFTKEEIIGMKAQLTGDWLPAIIEQL
jgi:NADH pyrophosphatase NudC (nudix superfamily)